MPEFLSGTGIRYLIILISAILIMQGQTRHWALTESSLTNVNANARVLTKPYLEKVAALADLFRPYGIKVFLTARFSAPIELDKLTTADPLNDSVRQWWKEKANEIYALIPDFGGFLVKANC